jgi:quercetin dioxygenase-like cupin family protein
MPKKKSAVLSPIGKKLKKFRMEKQLNLDNVATETGCSVDYLKKVEAGKIMPPVGTLLSISRALDIDSGLLLKEQESNASSRIKAYTKRTDNYAYKTLTPGAENKHLKAFHVTVDPEQEHKGVGYRHEGEEFVYVLKGKMEVTIGEHAQVLKSSDSLHFNSGIQHSMRNISKKTAEMIVVIYQP